MFYVGRAVARVVVAGGGVAGLYFIYNLKKLVDVDVVVVDPSDVHQFVVGIPIAVAGMVDFAELTTPFSQLKIKHIRGRVADVEGTCVKLRLAAGEKICGDYVVLAPGSVKIGAVEYWTVEGAQRLVDEAERADAVRFLVDVDRPVIGFQEVAYSLKKRFLEKEVSVHIVHIHHDYVHLLELWRKWAKDAGIELTDEPPPPSPTELHVNVPGALPAPPTHKLEVDPATFETQHPRIYAIGDSSLLKLDLPPIGWGALWQAATLAKAIAEEIRRGVFEIELATWDTSADKDKFYKWLTYRMLTGTPLAHLKGLLAHWKDVIAALS